MKGEAPRKQPTQLGKCLRKIFRFSFSNFGMLIIVFMYLIFGGFLFQFLENNKKIDSRAYFRRHRDECIQELWSVTSEYTTLFSPQYFHYVILGHVVVMPLTHILLTFHFN